MSRSKYIYRTLVYIIHSFDGKAQAKAIFDSLNKKDPRGQMEYIDNPFMADKKYCWLVYDGTLIGEAYMESVDPDIDRISARLYCALKNI